MNSKFHINHVSITVFSICGFQQSKIKNNRPDIISPDLEANLNRSY